MGNNLRNHLEKFHPFANLQNYFGRTEVMKIPLSTMGDEF